ncbi:hypothetical protein GCM10011379_24230 [Filimonas zeae]|uniref:Alpha-galactosidase n=2 Tax=Filimonas zeae TaxID=1737353 RepID=A0A917MY16_9BACT|nr:hypothetical protein GCM10011379_24230 [Filimonas zeae]
MLAFVTLFATLVYFPLSGAGQTTGAPRLPVMGWSSWNHFRIHIDEKLICQQADAMIASGLYEAGYRFINVDDGYFGGRDTAGRLFADSKKFPSGMKAVADYIHSKKLKAGIYTDAGKNTCGSVYDKDPNGYGVGIYGHVKEDCSLFLQEWGYDFLKVDWCGAERMQLKEEETYTPIIEAVKAIDSNKVINVCRWKFPGEWVIDKADSWRISSDIRPGFSSILKIIDLNADLAKYASTGHYNDMDMLQVGRGMTYEEDKTHFSMWCMLNSPLLAGNDLRNMSKETLEILTNRELIALNQDAGCKQATRVYALNGIEVWLKPLGSDGKSKALAIVNRNKQEALFTLNSKVLRLEGKSLLRDLWRHENLGKLGGGKKLTLPAHGVIVLLVTK